MKSTFKQDIRASLVLYLVALPLCLGIALASNAPIVSGIVAGIAGAIVVGFLSGSQTSVSGPAAGLTIIVVNGLQAVPSFEAFLLSVIIAGCLQIVLGKLKAGEIGDFIPGSVITGMIFSIGLIMVLKQIPHALGYDFIAEGDEEFIQSDGRNTFSEIFYAFLDINPGALAITLVSFFILYFWDTESLKRYGFFRVVPSQFIVVIAGICINQFFVIAMPNYALKGFHLSDVPIIDSESLKNWNFPDFTSIGNSDVWKLAITIALIASVETLLSIQAGDKIDTKKRISPPNKELVAQGFGNIFSGLLGGLPITAVIVRTSANINAGAQTRTSTISHGVLLLLSVFLLGPFINIIPKAALASILIHVGYKLANPVLFKTELKKSFNRFLPFLITIIAILFTDLLIGICIGIVSGIGFILVSNYRTSIMLFNDKNNYLLRFNKDVSFLNKKYLRSLLNSIPGNSNLLIDTTKADFVDTDIIEAIDEFIISARNMNINISVKRTATKPNSIFKNVE